MSLFLFNHRYFGACVVAIAVWATAPPAWAQSGSERTAAAREGARLRLGPFYLTPGLTIENIGVDNNVFLDAETQEPQSDFLISLAPSLRAALPLASRALITIDLAPKGDYYWRLENARAFTPQTDARAELFLNRMDVFVSGFVRAGRIRPSYEIEKRIGQVSNNLTVGARYRPFPKLTLEASVFRDATAVDDDELFLGINLDDALSNYQSGVRVNASRKLTAKTTAGLAVDMSTSHFEASPEREGHRIRIAPGFSFARNALVAGTLNVGVLRFVPKSASLPDFTGVVADVNLSARLREANLLTVRWRRDLLYSFEPLQPYYVLSGLGASLRRQVVGRIDAIMSFDQFESSYRNRLDIEDTPARVDTTRTYSGDLGVRLGRRSRIGLRVAKSSRDSTLRRERDYQATQLGLSYSYGM
jgi:hypothetical protein